MSQEKRRAQTGRNRNKEEMMVTRRQFLVSASALAGSVGMGLHSSRAWAAPTSPKPSKLVAIVTSTYGPALEAFAKEWTKQTGIPVEVISQSYDTTYTKIVTALAGGSATDIVIVDSIWTAGFVQAGFLQPLNGFVGSATKDLVPVSIDQRTIDGKVYSMPISNEAKFFYYNADILKAGGYNTPPRTWEEAAKISQDLKDKKLVKHGTIWGWQQSEGLICDYVALVNGLGGKLIDDGGKWIVNQGPGVKALEFMVDQLKSGGADPSSISLSDRQVVDSFSAGEHAFLMSWSFALGALNNPKNSKVVDKVKLDLVPGFASAGTTSTSVVGGSGFGVTATTKAADWAWDLIQFATDRTRQIEIFKIRSNVPVWKELYTNPAVVKEYPYISQMERQFEYATWRPNIQNYAELSGVLQLQIHKALSGQVSPQAALDQAATEMAKL
ncbi:extracellular solute-binding protein [Microvirga pudoricolor]|uniref:extracellular solute-binding protein n=1 Tax=Microvirga pudoricolor TaxID=2778729 RepID=UPI001952203C|nr:extracellular solute-binding protein [Microvirga pudoricolor]MBM6596290.1 extracellular solute-binding protein [Microvirga pudoricolor]